MKRILEWKKRLIVLNLVMFYLVSSMPIDSTTVLASDMKTQVYELKVPVIKGEELLAGNTGETVSVMSEDEIVEENTVEATYTDESGIIFSYYGYRDGTANIHTISNYKGKDLTIPEKVDDFTVTKITGKLEAGTNLLSLTIPRSIGYIETDTFESAIINSLYFNAVETSGSTGHPFYNAVIKNLVIGDQVKSIESKMFYQTKFTQDSMNLEVEKIGNQAFFNATFKKLTLSETVNSLGVNAFEEAKINKLHYNCNTSCTATSTTGGPFYNAVIQEMDIREDVTTIQDYTFSLAKFQFKTFAIKTEHIGNYAFYKAWYTTSTDPYDVNEIIFTENVKYIGKNAFDYCRIKELKLDADIETNASSTTTGCFYNAKIGKLSMGTNVNKIPDYMFSNAKYTWDELDLNVSSIGNYAFYTAVTNNSIRSLTLGEKVENIGSYSFQGVNVSEIHLNAINANVATGATLKLNMAPFSGNTFSNISIGSKVVSIPRALFAYSKITQEEIVFPDTVCVIGSASFFASKLGDINLGTLTIGENITKIGSNSFNYCKISELNYNAIKSQVVGAVDTSGSCFQASEIGHLTIGNKVTVIPVVLFSGMKLKQAKLVIPDSVTSIESAAFVNHQMSSNDIDIETLVIGKNVTFISMNAFTYCSFDNVIVYAIHGNEAYNEGQTLNPTYLPTCRSLKIHRNSDFYQYFSLKQSPNSVISMCESFDSQKGDTYYDENTNQFVTPMTDVCLECGYEKNSNLTEVAYTVTFLDFDGTVIKKQILKSGESASAPEISEREGYHFIGWDKAFSNVIKNIEVTAQYEINTYTVTFKDGDTILSTQLVKYGENAILPQVPTRPDESWGKWEFKGWRGNLEEIKQDEIVTALFEKQMNQYKVIFCDANGAVIKIENVPYGLAATAPEVPEKQSDEKQDFEFEKWSEDFSDVKSDLAVYPTYLSKIHKYTVTFMDKDKVLSEVIVSYGENAKEPENPIRKSEVWGNWKFIGWNGNFTNIIKKKIIRAIFKKEFNQYEVKFVDEVGNLLETQQVTYGNAAIAPADPVKETDELYEYSFSGWNHDFSKVTSNMVIQAMFEKKVIGKPDIEPEEPAPKPEPVIPSEPKPVEPEPETTIQEPVKPKPETEPQKPVINPNGPSQEVPTVNPAKPNQPVIDNQVPMKPDDQSQETTNSESVNKEYHTSITRKPKKKNASPKSDKDDSGIIEESTEMQKADEAEKDNNLRRIVIPIAGTATTGGIFVLLIFGYRRKRMIYGTIMRKDGTAVENARIELKGKENIQIKSDEDGYYCFKKSKRGTYLLEIFDKEKLILRTAINTEGITEKEVFDIQRKHCSEIITNRSRNAYIVDVII